MPRQNTWIRLPDWNRGISVDRVRMELERIREQDGGDLREEAIVDRAVRNRHPLHRFFVWNDEEAGLLYRLEQARNLIRSVGEIDTDAPPDRRFVVRAYVCVPGPEGKVYRPTQEVLADPRQAPNVIQEFLEDAEAFRERWDHVRILSQALGGIARIEQDVRRRFRRRLADG